jgi:FkbM family methyltransferase
VTGEAGLSAGVSIKRLIRAALPGRLRRRAIGAYARWRLFGLKAVGLWVQDLLDARKPFIRTARYRGFVLYYSRGTLFVDWMRFGGVWDRETADRIVVELSRRVRPTFVDVGANIGLMTLNVLAGMSAARVHAFEPGAHQRALLERTIAANGLGDQVTVYPEALGSHAGERTFAVHDPAHSALDGFIDTRRADLVELVTVPVRTLDGWWHSLGRPPVHVVKIDTEGAELWILEGARELLTGSGPVLFLEVQPANLRVYPYRAHDVLAWLARHRYGLEAYDGTPITAGNLVRALTSEENFIARPQPG